MEDKVIMIKIIRKFYFGILMLTTLNISGQTLTSDTLIKSFSRSELIQSQPLLSTMIQYGVKVYKITYQTPNIYDGESEASGLVVIPSNNHCSWSLMSYQHGTVTHKDNVPSRYNDEAQVGTFGAAIVGSVVALPDYLGLGDSDGLHPYIHSKTEASASLDMLRATRELCKKYDINLNDDVFIFGYSQGGHATLALQKLIENNHSEEFTIKYSIPMSGPYDLSGVQKESSLGMNEYSAPFYIPYILLSYRTLYPNLNTYSVDEMFASPYRSIAYYFNGQYRADQINALLPNIPNKMLNSDFYESVMSNSKHPLSLALAENDLTDWAPSSPIHFYYCGGDKLVSPLNSKIAYQKMSALDGTQVNITEIHPTFDHQECFIPSFVKALQTFISKTTTCNLLLNEIKNKPTFRISPNPVKDNLYITSNKQNTMKIYAIDGQLLLIKSIGPSRNRIDVSMLNAGIYLIKFGESTRKFIIDRQ